jgi:hypothetical protein
MHVNVGGPSRWREQLAPEDPKDPVFDPVQAVAAPTDILKGKESAIENSPTTVKIHGIEV